MRRIVLAGLALAAVAGVAGCGAASAGTASPSPSTSPRITAPAVPASVPLSVRYDAWWGKTGSDVKTMLYGDVTTLSGDLSRYNITAVMADGTQLTADAALAEASPAPPIDPADWRAQLALAGQAGAAFAHGDITTGGNLAQAATAKMNAFNAQALASGVSS